MNYDDIADSAKGGMKNALWRDVFSEINRKETGQQRRARHLVYLNEGDSVMAPHFVKRWLGNRAMRRAARKRMTAAKCSMPSKFFRPMLEILEDRTLLSVSWISTQSGFWDVGSNWSTGQAPTASDDVTINQPGVTVTVRNAAAAGTLSGSDALTIASGGSLNIANASTFGGNVSVSSGGTLSASASTTLSGSLNNAGTLTVQAGTLTVSGTVSQVSGTSLTAAPGM